MNPIFIEEVYQKFLLRFGITSYSFANFYNKPTWHNHKKWALALSFDIDYHKDEDALPLITSILRKNNVTASFAAIGKMIEKNPDIYKNLIDNNFEIINHSYSHPFHKEINLSSWAELDYYKLFEEIKKCDEICKLHLDYSPVGFRTPHFDRRNQNNLISVLKSLDYLYDSSGYDPRMSPKASFPFLIDGLFEIPCYREVSSYYCLRRLKISPEEWLNRVKKQFSKEMEIGGLASLYMDPHDLINHEDILEQIILFAKKNNAWITNLKGISSFMKKKNVS